MCLRTARYIEALLNWKLYRLSNSVAVQPIEYTAIDGDSNGYGLDAFTQKIVLC